MNSNALLLDDIDQSIVQQLRRDGRTPYKTLARQLDLTEATVRARVKRLEESDSLRVVAVSDYEAVGFGVLLAVGVQVEGRLAEDVAADLAELDAVFSVCQVVGARDIETLAVARDQDDLAALLSRLAAVPGVRKLEPSVALDVLKNQSHWVPFDQSLPAVNPPQEEVQPWCGAVWMSWTGRLWRRYRWMPAPATAVWRRSWM